MSMSMSTSIIMSIYINFRDLEEGEGEREGHVGKR
jgi:hypothetical protein